MMLAKIIVLVLFTTKHLVVNQSRSCILVLEGLVHHLDKTVKRAGPEHVVNIIVRVQVFQNNVQENLM